MDPTRLLAPAPAPGYPAPYWFLALLKGLGFTLHLIPMNLWFAGILVALLVRRRSPHAARFSARLLGQMPVIVALGINFGIVPLLFTQVAYARVFYPATILMAWWWFAIIGLLTVAYYGVYLYAIGLRERRMTWLRRQAGWAAAGLFVAIGFLFSNAFSLMTNVDAWRDLWLRHSRAGAATGLALNTADPTLLPRWLMVFGLALTTVAAYVVVDASLLARREGDAYRRWAGGFALRLSSVGLVWYAAAGAWYVFGTWGSAARSVMFGPLMGLTVATAASPGLVWLAIARQRREVRPRPAVLVAAAQVGALAANAASRQAVQNAELRRVLDVAAPPVAMEWSPVVLFLLLFVAGLAVVGWMVAKAIAAAGTPAPSSG